MFDNIEIISILLFVISIAVVVLGIKHRQLNVVFNFALIAILPLLWAGLIRLPIPQTLVWMGVNILAIMFILQGVVSLFIKQKDNMFISWPKSIKNYLNSILSIVTGAGFAAIILLARF